MPSRPTATTASTASATPAEAALQDAYKGSQTSHERQALEAEGRGVATQPATERLYVHVERYGCDANQPGFRWKKGTDGLIDLDLGDDEEWLVDAVTAVNDGFATLNLGAVDEWTVETALQDAHDYVHAYVIEGDDTGMWGSLADERTPFRTALDLRVRDVILTTIENR